MSIASNCSCTFILLLSINLKDSNSNLFNKKDFVFHTLKSKKTQVNN